MFSSVQFRLNLLKFWLRSSLCETPLCTNFQSHTTAITFNQFLDVCCIRNSHDFWQSQDNWKAAAGRSPGETRTIYGGHKTTEKQPHGDRMVSHDAKFCFNWHISYGEEFFSYIFRQYIFAISWLSPLEKGHGRSFEQTGIPITNECFVQNLVEISQLVLENFFLTFTLFRNYLPLEKGVALYFNKF